MANNFFKTLKSAFVTEIPDENIQSEIKSTQSVVSQPVIQQSVVSQPVFSPTIHPTSITGKVDNDLLQKLCQAMEDSNLPGPDYLELKNVANNDEMQKAMPDETQRLMVAFITMKSSNADMTKERVLSSIDEYIKMIELERKKGHEQLNSIWNEKVEARKQSVLDSEKRIETLQKELQELVQYVQKMNNEISVSSYECDTNKANFDTTVDFLVNNLKEDKVKLTNTLM